MQPCSKPRPEPRRGLSRSSNCIARWLLRRSSLFSPPLVGESRAAAPGFLLAWLSSIVGLWLGMNEHLEQLRRRLFEADLKLRGNIMHPRKRQIVGHGAVARHVHTATHALDLNIMHINNFRKFSQDWL